MTCAAPIQPLAQTALPRAIGTLRVSAKPTGLDHLYQKGALKAVFPRGDRLTAILVNTAGGVTGGDRFEVEASAAPHSRIALSTQAAERAYRALPGEVGRISTRLSIAEAASLYWLPQETIVFDGANLQRRLAIDLAEGAEALVVEPLIFGRAAMGERDIVGRMSDRIALSRAGRLDYLDAWSLDGPISDILKRPAIGNGATAMASLLFAGPRAQAMLDPVRARLPETGGASLKAPDLLVVRLLAKDGYGLRKSLLPILDLLTLNALPTCWRL